MESTRINKISKSIKCPDGKKLRFRDVDSFSPNTCDKKRIYKNFQDQCDGRDSCILDNSLLGCQGYDFDLAYSCIEDDRSSIYSHDSKTSSISAAITDSKISRLKEINYPDSLRSEESTQERSLIQNQEEENEVPLIFDDEEDVTEEQVGYIPPPPSFWDRFKHWIIGIMILLVIIAVIAAGIMFFAKESTQTVELDKISPSSTNYRLSSIDTE